ncbi:MAG: molybdopterin-binding protein [Variibacter sp.]
MSPPSILLQRIVKPTALPVVLRAVEQIAAVKPRITPVVGARGRVLAEDVFASAPLPAVSVAARDGWAVSAEAVADASSYAPVPVTAIWVDAGDPIPAATDTVLPAEAVMAQGGSHHALASAPAGEGMRAAGSDADASVPLVRRGTRLRATDVAALRACGIEQVSARRPHVAVIATPGSKARREATVRIVANAIAALGGVAEPFFCADEDGALERALRDTQTDAIVTVGGTGTGRHDATVRTVAMVGHVVCHGIGIAPGETSAFGARGETPILMLPGRLDAALAGWLLLGHPLLNALGGTAEPPPAARGALARKIVSTIGVAEMILVRRDGVDGVVPIAAGLFPLQALLAAGGYVVVPPESEGFPAGADVEVRALP